jgi:hypothetical protein
LDYQKVLFNLIVYDLILHDLIKSGKLNILITRWIAENIKENDKGEKEVLQMDLNLFNNKNDEEKKILKDVLEDSIATEESLMREYLITAERIHDDDELKERLENFAEGNAKRTKQLIDELNDIKE